MASTITEYQDDAAHGYIKDGRVKLIDGGTRVRAAKVSGVDHLDVKFEPEPESPLAPFIFEPEAITIKGHSLRPLTMRSVCANLSSLAQYRTTE